MDELDKFISKQRRGIVWPWVIRDEIRFVESKISKKKGWRVTGDSYAVTISPSFDGGVVVIRTEIAGRIEFNERKLFLTYAEKKFLKKKIRFEFQYQDDEDFFRKFNRGFK